MDRIKINITGEEKKVLQKFIKKGEKKARAITRANILLLANQNYGTDDISKILNVDQKTVWRIKKKYLKDGLKYILVEKPRSGQPRKYNKEHEAEIVATACTKPPPGRKRWTIISLTEEIKKINGLETINRESLRLILKKTKLNLG